MTATGAGINWTGGEDRAVTARRLVCDQHRELRRRLAAGIVEVDTLVDRRVTGRERLRSLLCTLCEALVAHQAVEEAIVVPILETELPEGPARARRLREDHARQRAALAALCGPQQRTDELELALRLDQVARTLLHDIAREERMLFNPGQTAVRSETHSFT